MKLFHPRLAVILHDLFMTWLAWIISYMIRYSVKVDAPELSWFSIEIALVVTIQGIVAYYFNLYRGLWRFASVPDLINIAKSVIVGTFTISFTLFFLLERADGVPRTVLILYPLLLMAFWGLPRLTYRVFKDAKLNILSHNKQKVLLVGAGRLADMFIRHSHSSGLYDVIGIVENNSKYKGANLRGVKVLGHVKAIESICDGNDVESIIVCKENITENEMRDIVDNSMSSHCKLLTLPNLDNIHDKSYDISHLKPITIDDLLGREKVSIDWANVSQKVQGKSVLITGGGGSIGSELARQLAKFDLKCLCILDHSEYNLYQIDRELTDANSDLLVKSLLVNVTDKAHLFQIFSKVKPDIVFHAAAYKHVPLIEKMPCEGFINNVIGTKNVVDTCDQFNIEKMILVSTDKAVNPYSIMGATKRIAETYCQSKNLQSNTDYIIVRFGNVLGSAGSVVPLFKEQIDNGGPVTITHKDITRYFMTITEACQLIVQSMVLGSKGDIHVLDMGKPISIMSLAKRMITLSGKIPNIDIDIAITGLRAGEKLHEQLYYDVEQLKHTSHNKIFHISSDSQPMCNYDEKLHEAMAQAINFQENQLTESIKVLVPEFVQQKLKIVDSNIKKEKTKEN